ncbi:MAG: N-acetylmuramoyl-L-alanine amidase [Chthoniobacterales bacterium]|nr:N-acetylmuramoyl-L-alanine amidase [Chthoniobacterales bacterium]
MTRSLSLLRHRLLARCQLVAFALAIFTLCASTARGQGRTIVIDAGHGGHDRGGVPGQRVSEKMMTLDVAQRLRSVLQARGYRVVMTRNSDVFIPLGTRTSIANSYRGATFVSVHFNSASRSGANGIETYYYRRDSGGLAASIHRNVVAIAPTENRGIRRRAYFVLRRTNNPGVLVECGFLTNPTEARYALNPSYRQRLAEAIARGIQRLPSGPNKPLTAGSAASADVLAPTISGPDVVRAAPRVRHYRSSRSKKSARTRSKKSSTPKKKRKRSSSTIIQVDWRPC